MPLITHRSVTLKQDATVTAGNRSGQNDGASGQLPSQPVVPLRFMGAGNSTLLEHRVARAAKALLERQQYVSPVDLLVSLGWLTPAQVDDWRRGRVTCLERVVQANLHKLSTAMRHLRRWATDQSLNPRETVYVAHTRNRGRLRFSVSGKPDIERAYSTHWVSPLLAEAKRRRLAERQSLEREQLDGVVH